MSKAPPAKIVNFVTGIRYKLSSLQQKMVPPPIAALDFVNGMWGFQIAYAICELGIADHLSNSPRSAADIARSVGALEDPVYRLLRAASNLGIAKETGSRSFTGTPVSETMKTNSLGSVRDFILLQGRVGWKSWAGLTDCVKNGKTAIENMYNKKPFEYLTSPEVAETFNRAMTGISAMAIDSVLAAYSFASIKKIVDVGGGHGRLVGTIVKNYPQLQGVLIDLPHVVQGAPTILKELGVSQRVETQGGDFFKPLPKLGGDLVIMKTVIHDWSDEDSVQILKNVREVLNSGGRLLLCETVVTEPNVPSFSKFLDIEMLVHAGGRERTADQFAALFNASGFRLTRIIPTAGPMSLIEAELKNLDS